MIRYGHIFFLRIKLLKVYRMVSTFGSLDMIFAAVLMGMFLGVSTMTIHQDKPLRQMEKR